jgi:hypothetical protein
MTVMTLERPARAVAADTIPSPCAIVELRRYALHPGRRETLIELFDREFVHTQEDCGMRVLGQFRDLDAPDDFVWLRGFSNMAERRDALAAFYGGPVWRRHRDAANATMQDSSNVLLLRNVQTAATHSTRPGMLLAVVCQLDAPVTPPLVHRFEHEVRPCLQAAGMEVQSVLMTERAPNDFPALPVRTDTEALVWICRFDSAAHQLDCADRLFASAIWRDAVWPRWLSQLSAAPQMFRLQPTAGSAWR